MKKASKYSPKSAAVLPGILVGAGVSLAVCLLGAALLAWLIVFEKVEEGLMQTGSMVILVLASWTGSAVAWSLVKRDCLAVCGMTAGIFYAALLLAALTFGGQFNGMGAAGAMVLLGGAISLIPAVLGSRSGGKKYKIRAIR